MNEPFEELVPMMAKAKAEGLWFHCNYQDLWFSPTELEDTWGKGRFQWGAVNWNLRNPQEYKAEAQRRVDVAKSELERIERRISK